MKKIKLSTENVAATIMFLIAFLLPFFMNSYGVNTFSYYYANIILALSITLVWGFAGVFSFGQAAFMGLGTYIYGIIGRAFGGGSMTWAAMIISIICVTILGAVLGYFMFYGGVNDVFVGLITLCVGIAFETFLGQTAGNQWKILGVPLGGYNGMSKIPMLSIGEHKFNTVEFYFLVLIVLLAIYIAIRKTQNTRFGYSLLAIRENRQRSELFGYNVPKIQVVVFAISTGMAALAGVFYGAWGNYVSPNNMSMAASTIPVVIVASGGRKNPTASAIFGLLYYVLSNKLAASGSELNLVILGFVLIVVLLFIPQGLISAIFYQIDSFFANLKSKHSKVRG